MTDRFEYDKTRLLLKILKVLMLVIGIMSIIRLLEQNYIQFWADIGFLAILLAGYQFMKNNLQHYKTLVRLIYFISAVFSIFVMLYQSENPVRFIWLSTVIYMTFYLFTRKEALYWIGIIAGLIGVAFLVDPDGFHICLSDFLIWVMNMLIVLMIAHWYATIEDESHISMMKTQELLSEEVWRKTQELRILNESLEARIEEKIRKNAEQEKLLFRQARYAQMGEMISMIAHQWRQPLNTISITSGTIQMYIEMDQCDKPMLQSKIQTISESVKHLSQTIDDFRNFFKLDKEKKELKFSTIVKSALELIEGALERKNITIHIDYLCECKVYSYPNEIIHVILNLLKNAEDALLERRIETPRITIRTYCNVNTACLEVEDNAGGIAPDIMEKIFDPYYTTKGKHDGTGLGLYMSKIIIEDHCQGKIEVENSAKGALFRLLLPFKDKGEKPS